VDNQSEKGPPRLYPIPNPRAGPITFSHPAEAAFAQILDFYQMKWEYEPVTFPLEWDEEGNVLVAFSPDFYLIDDDMYVELTTMKQNLVTKKNRKLRLLQELYPGVKCKLMYRRDIKNLAVKYGLFDQDAAPVQDAHDENEENGE